MHTFSVLEKLAELQACQDELVAQQRELVAVDGELATLRNSNCRWSGDFLDGASVFVVDCGFWCHKVVCVGVYGM